MPCVMGESRVPDPPARMIPLECMLSFVIRLHLHCLPYVEPSRARPKPNSGWQSIDGSCRWSHRGPSLRFQGTTEPFYECRSQTFLSASNPVRAQSCAHPRHSGDRDLADLFQTLPTNSATC